MLVTRIDHGRLDASALQRTGSGGVRVPGRLTRSGVFIYRDASGKERREWRPPEEVFAAESLNSLRMAPVTDRHPPGLVTPQTYKRDAIGSVADEVRRDGIFVASELVVQDAAAVAKVERGELREVSLGYTCEVEERSGVTPDGQRFDAIQRGIRYNHAALGPRGWGRAGRDVALRLDGAEGPAWVQQDDGAAAPQPPQPRRVQRSDAMKVTIGGITYEVGTPAHIQALEKKAADAEARAASQEARADAAEDEVKALKPKLEKATAELAAATSTERMDALVQERAALLDRSRRVMGADYAIDGKAPRQVHEEVLAKAGVDVTTKLDGKDEATQAVYLAARFDAVTEKVESAAGGTAPAAKGTGGVILKVIETRQDGDDDGDQERLDAVSAAEARNKKFYASAPKRFALTKER